MYTCTLYMYGSDGLNNKPYRITAISIEHASAVVSMLNQMTDGRSIMHEVKDVV